MRETMYPPKASCPTALCQLVTAPRRRKLIATFDSAPPISRRKRAASLGPTGGSGTRRSIVSPKHATSTVSCDIPSAPLSGLRLRRPSLTPQCLDVKYDVLNYATCVVDDATL